MAVAHLSVKIGKAGKGAVHAEYVSREGKYKQRLNQGEKLEAVESGNMPKWAEADPMYFWQMADAFERKNGSVYREHEIALPRELNKEQRIELVRNWVKKELGENHAYTWAIHNKIGLDGEEQPHVHLMFSDRLIDGIERSPEQYFKRYNPRNPEKGGCRKANYQSSYAERKEALKKLRQRWEDLHNGTLRSASICDADISMLSYQERGIDKVAQAKMLPSESRALHLQNAINRALKGYRLNGLEILTEEEQKTIVNFYDSINKNHKEKTIEKRLEALIDLGSKLSALEREEAKVEYEARLKEAEELEKLLMQSISQEQRAKRELDEAQRAFWRVRDDYEKCKQTMADTEKRIAELEGQILGKWRNGEEIERLKGLWAESEAEQQKRRARVEELEKTRQRLSEALKEAVEGEARARDGLKRLQPAISVLGDLLRLAQVAPEKREAWKESEKKREARCVGLLPSVRESALEDELKRFERGDERKQQKRGRGFSR